MSLYFEPFYNISCHNVTKTGFGPPSSWGIAFGTITGLGPPFKIYGGYGFHLEQDKDKTWIGPPIEDLEIFMVLNVCWTPSEQVDCLGGSGMHSQQEFQYWNGPRTGLDWGSTDQF